MRKNFRLIFELRFERIADNFAERKNTFVGDRIKNRIAFLTAFDHTGSLQYFQMFRNIRLAGGDRFSQFCDAFFARLQALQNPQPQRFGQYFKAIGELWLPRRRCPSTHLRRGDSEAPSRWNFLIERSRRSRCGYGRHCDDKGASERG